VIEKVNEEVEAVRKVMELVAEATKVLQVVVEATIAALKDVEIKITRARVLTTLSMVDTVVMVQWR
jgi:hypothetical protein